MPGLGLDCMGLLFGKLAVGVALVGVISWPYGPIAKVTMYVRAEPIAVQVIATSRCASSVPLALYVALACTCLRQLGVALSAAVIALNWHYTDCRCVGSAGRQYGGAQPDTRSHARTAGVDQTGDRRRNNPGIGLAEVGYDTADHTRLGAGLASGGRRARAARRPQFGVGHLAKLDLPTELGRPQRSPLFLLPRHIVRHDQEAHARTRRGCCRLLDRRMIVVECPLRNTADDVFADYGVHQCADPGASSSRLA